MFVSAYSTYINTSSNNSTKKDVAENKKSFSPSFKHTLLTTPNNNISVNGNKLQLNYISNYKALNNRQQLEHQNLAQSAIKDKFTKISSIKNAQVAYTDNSKIFPLILKPKQTLDQTPKLDKNLSIESQKGQKSIMKNLMVNTYIENENYYRITA